MATKFATAHAKGEDTYLLVRRAAQEALAKLNATPDIAIVFAGKSYDPQELQEGIKSLVGDIPVIGCTSAGEFTESAVTKNGIVIALISSDSYRFYAGVGTNISYDEIKAVETAAKSFPGELQGFPYRSVMILVDGLAGKGEEIVLAASSVLGDKIKFAGGAAADEWELDETRVFADNKSFVNAVVLCLIASKQPVIITVKHGHVPISPPLKITKAKDNVVYEVNGQPAVDVWKRYLKDSLKDRGINIDEVKDHKELARLFGHYELGLMTGDQYKNRFTFSCNSDGSLHFGCSIVEGAVFKIMSSSAEAQIKSSQEAAIQAVELAKGKKIAGAIVFDCACRGKILKDKFPDTVLGIKNAFGDIPFIGFETYGEIAMEEGQLSGYHNATTVIMLFPE